MSKTCQAGESRTSSTLHATLLSMALMGSIALSVQAFAAADCEAPVQPTMPDGAKATMEEMLAGQQAVKAFQTENMQYMQCLEALYTAAEGKAKAAKDKSVRDAAEAQYRESIEAYNTAVSVEEEVAGAFNIALRAYKAANR